MACGCLPCRPWAGLHTAQSAQSNRRCAAEKCAVQKQNMEATRFPQWAGSVSHRIARIIIVLLGKIHIYIFFNFNLIRFYFFSFIFISWRLITLQYWSGFCHIFDIHISITIFLETCYHVKMTGRFHEIRKRRRLYEAPYFSSSFPLVLLGWCQHFMFTLKWPWLGNDFISKGKGEGEGTLGVWV